MEVRIKKICISGSEQVIDGATNGMYRTDWSDGEPMYFAPIDKDIGSDPNSLLRLLGFETATEEEIREIERVFTYCGRKMH